MSSWLIPVIVSDVEATPRPPATGPGFPNRNFGLIGVLSIMNNSGIYTGEMIFTKPDNYFGNRVYSIASPYITVSPVLTVTIPQAASDCQANFSQNGTYNPGANNPPLFDTATVNSNGQFTQGNLSLPDFTLKGTWDNSKNTITNGEIWLPYRYLWAIWGNQPNQSQTPWAQINMSFGPTGASSTNAAVFSLDPALTPTWGTNGLELDQNDYVILDVNFTGIALGRNQGFALNISCVGNIPALNVSYSRDKTNWTTIPPGFLASVAQQCSYMPPSWIPPSPFYLRIENQTGASVVVSAAQLLY